MLSEKFNLETNKKPNIPATLVTSSKISSMFEKTE